MANGDVYQVVDTGSMYGQKMLNVYFFKMTDAPSGDGNALNVCEGFISTMMPLIAACQCDDLIHSSIKATNLFDASDAHETLISTAGVNGNPSDSAFDAVGFRLTGDNAAVRSGAKRLPGIADSDVDLGVITSSGEITALDAYADGLKAAVPFGLLDAGSLIPVIVKRLLVSGEYVLPSTIEEAILSVVIDALWSTVVTTQNSRKIGRGE